ncbi:hypothetical protein RYX36_012309 [Vicia faba]
MIEVGITDPLESPLALDAMLGLKLAFKVKWVPQWSSASIVMYLNGEELFKQLERNVDLNGIDQITVTIDVVA